MITQKAMTDVTAMVEGIVRKVALHPEKVRVDTKSEGDTTGLFLYLAQPDFQTFSQSDSRAVKSLRVVTEALALRSGLKLDLNVLEEV